MNFDVLKRLSVDQLRELRLEVDKEIGNRLDFRVIAGRTGKFLDSKNIMHYCRIERVNPKSVTVVDLDNGAKWRISKSIIEMDGVEISTPQVKKIEKHTPKNYNVTAW